MEVGNYENCLYLIFDLYCEKLWNVFTEVLAVAVIRVKSAAPS